MVPIRRLVARAHSAELAAAAEQMLASCWRGANRQAEPVDLGSLRLDHAPRPCIRVGWPGLGPARPRSPQPARRCLRIGSISRRCRCSALLLALPHAATEWPAFLQAGAPVCGAFSLHSPPPIAPQRQSMAAAATTEDKLLRALADACDSGNKAEVSRLLSAGALVNGKLPGAVSAVRDEVGVVPTRSDHESGCCEAWNRLEGGREKGQMPRLAERSRPQLPGQGRGHWSAGASPVGVVVVDVRFCAPGWRCVSSQYGSTALFRASEHGHTDIVRVLLDRGANVDATNDVSQPTYLAAAPPSLHGAAGPRPLPIERVRTRWPAEWEAGFAWSRRAILRVWLALRIFAV